MPAVSEKPIGSPAQQYWKTRWTHARHPNSWALQRGEAILGFLRGLGLKSPRILDFGCGTGWFAARLAEFGKVLGVDPSPAAIAEAQNRYPQLRFFTHELERVDSISERFDVVVCQEVLPHVEDQRALLHGMADLLVPGGWLIVATANRYVVERLGDRNWNWDIVPEGHVEKHVTLRQLKRLLWPRFEIHRAITVVPMGQAGILRWINSAKLNAALGILVSPARLAAWKQRAGLGYHMVVLAQRRSE